MKQNEKGYSGAKIASIIFFAFVIIYVLTSLIVGAICNLTDVKEGFLFLTVNSLISPFSMLLTALVFGKRIKAELEKRGRVYRKISFEPIYLLIALMLACGMFFGVGFINVFIEKLVLRLGGRVNSFSISLVDRPFKLIVFFITYCVLPAIFEEWFFRDVILEFMPKVRPIALCLTVGLSFALFHGSITQLIYQFFYGCTLTLLAYKSRSVLPATISHFINNSAVLFLGYFGVEINLFSPLIILGVLCLVGFFLFVKFYKPQKIEAQEGVKDFYFPFGAFTFLLLIVIAVMGVVPL